MSGDAPPILRLLVEIRDTRGTNSANLPGVRTNKQGRRIEVVAKRLTVASQTIGTLSRLLSDAERARARRFAFDRDARRFVVGRGRLRQLLGGRLGASPGAVELVRAAQGKPALARQGQDSDLRFNLSHSGDLAVYAFASGREVGVDVEAVRAIPDADAIVARWFSPREQAAYRALDQCQKPLAFFTCWTRKEAVIKALGQGLSYPLSRLHVGLTAGDPVSVVYTDGSEGGGPAGWSVQTLFPARGYVAATAISVSPAPQPLFAGHSTRRSSCQVV